MFFPLHFAFFIPNQRETWHMLKQREHARTTFCRLDCRGSLGKASVDSAALRPPRIQDHAESCDVVYQRPSGRNLTPTLQTPRGNPAPKLNMTSSYVNVCKR